MARLIYTAIASLDGYIEDERGKFDWAKPDEEVHAFVNDLERPIGTHLYGRRLYEVMFDGPSVTPESEPTACSLTRIQAHPPTVPGGWQLPSV